MSPGLCRGRLQLLLLIWIFCPLTAPADDLPLWEAGFGLAPISFPDYRGSKSQNIYLLPLPYFIYRGDALRVDRGGIRGVLVDTPRFEINLSMDGAVPVSSHDDGPRSGMPDLDSVVEAGPSMKWLLGSRGSMRLEFRLPARAATAVDARSIRHVGWKFHPQLNVSSRRAIAGWNLGLVTGPLFSSRAYNKYYYGVSSPFATEQRPEYRAHAGYGGWALLAAASRRFDSTWIGAFLRYDNLEGARFRDSPLVETKHALTLGLGVARILGRSSVRVSANNLGWHEAGS